MSVSSTRKSAMPESRAAVSRDCIHDIEQHYYREARLLQDGRYQDWIETCVAEDIHYWLPVLEERLRRDKRSAPSPDEAAIFNDDYAMLKMRVDRLDTGQVWMEDPPSRIRYLITNVEAYESATPNEFDVYSNFAIHRHRRQNEHYVHVGGREDHLRRIDGAFVLVRRKITLDARVVQDKNLYFFA